MPVTEKKPHVVLGSGPAGTTLAAELASRGHSVRLVNRSGTGEALEGVVRAAGDVSTVEGATEAIRGAGTVYHCVNVAYHLQVDHLPQVQRAVLGAAESAGARLVVLDTTYPYGETHGEIMTERTPWRATGRKGRMRAELDEIYLAAHREGRVRTVLGRAADFVGPRVLISTLGVATFPAALTGGEAVSLGDVDLPHSFTDIRSVAAGLATLGERPEGDGRVWHLPTAPALTVREIHAMIEERTGQPLKTRTLSEPKPFGPFDEMFMESYAELFYQHTEGQTMDSTAIRESFGLEPVPMEETLDATLDWYRGFLARTQD
ncbi:NAD-dependent epimerase/dehydratase family protein [Streptomyces tsukubensis]|uniref:Epimerase n=1 Tax=Streptomyces tsukubensis TaxID=83656 RepID=A0A1V4A092_9ACTN|nr:NAD-dependent epimerase/dehydratase family protein [Streptomyces tsukubensis]OON71887.1 epimerase [Streptomyces tsukubensis]QFR91840.1 NAD(P)H-binding protein [Streptomyces tsukubensis]